MQCNSMAVARGGVDEQKHLGVNSSTPSMNMDGGMRYHNSNADTSCPHHTIPGTTIIVVVDLEILFPSMEYIQDLSYLPNQYCFHQPPPAQSFSTSHHTALLPPGHDQVCRSRYCDGLHAPNDRGEPILSVQRLFGHLRATWIQNFPSGCHCRVRWFYT